VEDVVARGPAEGKLKLGDTIVRIGGKHLAQLQYGEAIQALREAGPCLWMTVRRRGPTSLPKQTQKFLVSLFRRKEKQDFGVKFGCRVYVASVNEEAGSRGLSVGDTLLEVGGAPVEGMSLAKVERMVRQTKSKAISLLVEREEHSQGLLPKVSNPGIDAKPNNVERYEKISNAEKELFSQLKTRTTSNIYLEGGTTKDL